MVADEGIYSPFKGIAPIMARSLPYTMVQLSTFETVTAAIYSELDSLGNCD
jgi:Mitochondrial carrier protein